MASLLSPARRWMRCYIPIMLSLSFLCLSFNFSISLCLSVYMSVSVSLTSISLSLSLSLLLGVDCPAVCVNSSLFLRLFLTHTCPFSSGCCSAFVYWIRISCGVCIVQPNRVPVNTLVVRLRWSVIAWRDRTRGRKWVEIKENNMISNQVRFGSDHAKLDQIMFKSGWSIKQYQTELLDFYSNRLDGKRWT